MPGRHALAALAAALLLGPVLADTPCVNCALGTSGVCKDAGSGMCWAALPGGFGCSAPGKPCDATGNVPRLYSNLTALGFPQFGALPPRPAVTGSCPPKRIVAYFPSPYAVYKPASEHLQASNIQSSLFTHGVYFAAQIASTPPYGVYYVADQEMPVIHDFLVALRANACNRAIISISTYYYDRANNPQNVWSTMASNPTYRATFISTAIMFARQTGFDGIELHWYWISYPFSASGVSRASLTTLLVDLRQAIDTEATLTGNTRLTLSLAISNQPYVIADAYNLTVINQTVDWVTMHAYNYHGSWEALTAMPASLRDPAPADSMQLATSVRQSVSFLTQSGLPPSFINLAATTTAVVWTIPYGIVTQNVPRIELGVGTNASGAGQASPVNSFVGTATYKEIASLCTVNSTVGLYTEGLCNYLWGGVGSTFVDYQRGEQWGLWTDQWVAYESPLSLPLKTLFMWNVSLGGIALWNIDGDDFANGFPLLTALYAGALVAPSPSPSTTVSMSLSFTSTRSMSGTPSPLPLINTVFEIQVTFALPYGTIPGAFGDPQNLVVRSGMQALLGSVYELAYLVILVDNPTLSNTPTHSVTPNATVSRSPTHALSVLAASPTAATRSPSSSGPSLTGASPTASSPSSSLLPASAASSPSSPPSSSHPAASVAASVSGKAGNGTQARMVAVAKSATRSTTPSPLTAIRQDVRLVVGVNLTSTDASWQLRYQTVQANFLVTVQKVLSQAIGAKVSGATLMTRTRPLPSALPSAFEFAESFTAVPSPSASLTPIMAAAVVTSSPLSISMIAVIAGVAVLLLVTVFLIIHFRIRKYYQEQLRGTEGGEGALRPGLASNSRRRSKRGSKRRNTKVSADPSPQHDGADDSLLEPSTSSHNLIATPVNLPPQEPQSPPSHSPVHVDILSPR